MILNKQIIPLIKSIFDSKRFENFALYAFIAIFLIFLAALLTNLLPLIALGLLLAFIWRQSNNVIFHRG
tara:strand:- start:22889 stop:23095 length:207 start_codon:yes stop_codon:yes gene_type:complete